MYHIIEELSGLVKKEDKINLYKNHISLVVRYACMLAGMEGEDADDMEAAALLHDIGRIRYGGDGHNLRGAEDARRILESHSYESSRIQKICDAIVSHSGEPGFPVKDRFGEILRCADGLSHHDVVPLFLTFQLKKSGNDLKTAITGLIDKLDSEWNRKITLRSAREIGKEKYDAAMLVLRSNLELIEAMENER